MTARAVVAVADELVDRPHRAGVSTARTHRSAIVSARGTARRTCQRK